MPHQITQSRTHPANDTRHQRQEAPADRASRTRRTADASRSSGANRQLQHACLAFVSAIVLAILTVLTLAPAAKAEMISVQSAHGFQQTLARLTSMAEARDFQVFATIDHAKAARSVDLEMNPATVVIFGNPSIGTGVMRQVPELAVVLPIRVLVWQDDAGAVRLGFQSLVHEGAGLGMPADHPFLTGATGGIRTLIEAVAR